jgi:hypothetical protein
MITFDNAGMYLGRVVKFGHISSVNILSRCNNISLSSSTVLIYSHTLLNVVELDLMIKYIVSAEPIAIVLAGIGANEAFDRLLNYLDSHTTTKHIMTRLCDEPMFEDVVNDFLIATWPSEERHDEWSTYYVLTIENVESNLTGMFSDIKKLVD